MIVSHSLDDSIDLVSPLRPFSLPWVVHYPILNLELGQKNIARQRKYRWITLLYRPEPSGSVRTTRTLSFISLRYFPVPAIVPPVPSNFRQFFVFLWRWCKMQEFTSARHESLDLAVRLSPNFRTSAVVMRLKVTPVLQNCRFLSECLCDRDFIRRTSNWSAKKPLGFICRSSFCELSTPYTSSSVAVERTTNVDESAIDSSNIDPCEVSTACVMSVRPKSNARCFAKFFITRNISRGRFPSSRHAHHELKFD